MLTSLSTASSPFKNALNTVPLAAKSLKGSKLVYIIVEDESDMLIYQKFFDFNCTHIFISCISDKENASGSCLYVEKIVKTISQTSSAFIIGIRDADYTTFDTNYSLPDNVFRTDARDIEMMLFECNEVTTEFNKKIDFQQYYNKTVTAARIIGYYRIFNDINKLGFSFKNQLNYSELLDKKSGDMIAVSFVSFSDVFFADSENLTKDDLDNFIKRIEHAPNSVVCRGHDVVTILANYLRNKYTKKEIELTMAVYYSFDSFKETRLYRDIEKWGIIRGKQLFF